MDIGNKIKKLRLSKGLTLEEVGNYVGVSKSTVLKWERGQIQNMRRDKIAKLAEILGTTPDIFIDGSDRTKQNISPAGFTEHEVKVIEAYRANLSMQSAVDKLLGVEEDTTTIEEDAAETFRRVSKKSVHQ